MLVPVEVEYPSSRDEEVYTESQAAVLLSDEPLVIVNAGRGWGKDHIALRRMLPRVIQKYFERKEQGFRRSGPTVMFAIVAPSEPNYRETWLKLLDMVPKVPGLAKDGTKNYRVDRRKGTIYLFGENELVIQMYTAWNPDTLRGPGWDYCLITEAAFLPFEVFDTNILPMVWRSDYVGEIMMISTPNNGWWDDAVTEALEQRGEFATWKAFQAPWWDNPKMTAVNREKILQMGTRNPQRFLRERMAELHIIVPADDGAGRAFDMGLWESAYSMEHLSLTQGVPPLVAFDLAYGGEDKMVRVVFDRPTNALVHIDIWTSKELDIRTDNPAPKIVKLFEDAAREFPGCKIAYDCTGPRGSLVINHIPRHLVGRVTQVHRGTGEKNKHVGELLNRLESRDAQGKSVGIRIPHPDSKHLSIEQRKNIKILCEQALHFREIVEDVKGTKRVRYTKGEGYGDDAIDAVTIACSQLPPMRAPVQRRPIRERSLGLYA